MSPEHRRKLDRLIKSMPDDVEEGFSDGVLFASRLTDDKLSRAIELIAKTGMPAPETQSAFEPGATDLGISAAQLESLRMVVFVATGASSIGGKEDITAEFVDMAAEQGLIEDAHKKRLAEIFAISKQHHDAFSEVVSRDFLAGQTLPKLRRCDISVDVRLQFGKDRNIVDASPVAVINIDTSGENQVIWFQANRNQIATLAARFAKVLEQMDAAAKWIPPTKKE